MMLIDDQRTGDACLERALVSLDDLFLVLGLETNLSTQTVWLVLTFDSWISFRCCEERIEVSVPGLTGQFARGHLEI